MCMFHRVQDMFAGFFKAITKHFLDRVLGSGTIRLSKFSLIALFQLFWDRRQIFSKK